MFYAENQQPDGGFTVNTGWSDHTAQLQVKYNDRGVRLVREAFRIRLSPPRGKNGTKNIVFEKSVAIEVMRKLEEGEWRNNPDSKVTFDQAKELKDALASVR
jgi:hypothetical protein